MGYKSKADAEDGLLVMKEEGRWMASPNTVSDDALKRLAVLLMRGFQVDAGPKTAYPNTHGVSLAYIPRKSRVDIPLDRW